MVVIGIDADTRRVAYGVVEDGLVLDVGEIPRTNTTGRFDVRYDQALTTLVRRAQASGAVIYLEDVYLPETRNLERGTRNDEIRNVQTLIALAAVQGEIKARARQHGVPVEPVSANVWRSAVLGQTVGRERLKALAMERARQSLQSSGYSLQVELTEHMAEAVCIAEFGTLEMRNAEC